MNDFDKILFIPEDMPTYLSELRAGEALDGLSIELDGGGEYARVLRKYLCKKHFFFYAKLRYSKKIVRALAAEVPSKLVKIRTPLSLKQTVYMTDGGELVISVGETFKTEPFQMLKIVLHEYAHLYLAGRADYPDLKALDARYFARFGRSGETLPVSPIEYYATAFGCALLRASAAVTDCRVLTAYADEEKEKVRTLVQSLPGGSI